MSEAEVYRAIRLYVITLVALTAFAWSIFLVRGPVLHKTLLHQSLFCCQGDQFTDFTDLSARVAHFGEPGMLAPGRFAVPYPYPVSSMYAFLFFVRVFPHHSLRAYMIFVMLSFSIACALFALGVWRISMRWLPQIAIWSTLIVGFPLLFLLDRANIEGLMWVFIVLGLVAFTRNRLLLAAIPWVVAASMKIFPGLLFVLFLAKRRYGVFATAVALTAVVSVLSLAGVGPTVRQAALESSQSAPFLRDNYILARNQSEFDHSLFAIVKTAVRVHTQLSGHGHPGSRAEFLAAFRVYNVVILLGVLLLYWYRLRHLPLLNQFIAYMVMCILFPYVSGDYTLVYGYLVWAAFLYFLLADVATGRAVLPARVIYIFFTACAVVFVPLTYLQIPDRPGHTFGIAGQVKAAFLVVLMLLALCFRMPSSLFGDPDIRYAGDLN